MSDIELIKGDKKKNFTVLDNTCIRDENLSWGAKGLHCYLEHLPGDWKIYKSYLVSHFPEKINALNKLFRELVDAGYIKIEKDLRNSDGTFAPQRYIIFEKPHKVENTDIDNTTADESIADNTTADNTTADNSTADATTADTPSPENPHILNTNLSITNSPNIDSIKTEPTNSSPLEASKFDSETDNIETVSESVFCKTIKGLFENEYPFDNNFEADVNKLLSDYNIDETHIEDYLKYVFERTNQEKVKKSFEGLYRKLALAKPIVRDFKNSTYMKAPETVTKVERKVKYIECSICGTQFDEILGYCPTCNISIKELNNPKQPSYIVAKKYFEMSDEEKQKYDAEYSAFIKKLQERERRAFATDAEKLDYWFEIGILTKKELEDDEKTED